MSIKNLYPNIEPSLNLSFALTKALDPRITFSRASSGAVYDGKTVAKAEENLLLRSQEFDNSFWVKTSVTVSANTSVAPDGTTTAETLTASAGASAHDVAPPTNEGTMQQGLVYSTSVFAKKGTNNFLQICFLNQTDEFANFDLDAGTVGTTGGATMSASITSVGSGWFRCMAVITPASAAASKRASFSIVPSASATRRESWTADGTETILLWGAQLEQRASVTAYTPTTTAPITNYVPVLLSAANNVARFDHNPVTGESLGLLIEESRTNTTNYSEQFDNSWWNKTRATITANTVVAPDGTLTGDKLVEDTTASNSHYTRATAYSVVSGTSYTWSVYLKAGERTKARVALQLFGTGSAYPTTNPRVDVDLVTGTLSNANGTIATSITNAGNGWYRVAVSATANANAADQLAGVFLLDGAGNQTYTGDGTSGLFIWGAQLEAGAFPTSYIPTTTAAATRAADVAVMTGANFSSWYRADEGTLYAETQITYQVGTNPLIVGLQQDLVSSTQITMFLAGGTPNYRASIRENLVESFLQNVVSLANINDVNKWAIAYKENDSVSVGRFSNATDTTVRVPPGINSLNFGAVSPQVKYVRKIAFYPKRLANDQLQGITTV
jgi:hypothetical protein